MQLLLYNTAGSSIDSICEAMSILSSHCVAGTVTQYFWLSVVDFPRHSICSRCGAVIGQCSEICPQRAHIHKAYALLPGLLRPNGEEIEPNQLEQICPGRRHPAATQCPSIVRLSCVENMPKSDFEHSKGHWKRPWLLYLPFQSIAKLLPS